MELNSGRKKAESGRHHGAATAGDKHAGTLLVGHDLVVIYRLIEMD